MELKTYSDLSTLYANPTLVFIKIGLLDVGEVSDNGITMKGLKIAVWCKRSHYKVLGGDNKSWNYSV